MLWEDRPSIDAHRMRVVVAEDDPVSCRMLARVLQHWGYRVDTCSDGHTAWQLLTETSAPTLVMLDWIMPGLDGAQVCRQLRQTPGLHPIYVILLTARGQKAEVIAGLRAGADDYISKPFDDQELLVRLRVGMRVLTLQQLLSERLRALEEALARGHRLRGLLPICTYCKKIRNHDNAWEQLESFISEHSEAQFTHSICPDCYTLIVRPQLENLPSLRRSSP